ncbi:MAG: N-6 DNA methylase [Firmicutes bacterium]|nr:N-6 DNA methylase [Bacillota bacterium]
MEKMLKPLEGEFSLGKFYQQSLDKDIKKAHGKYYTPDIIIDFILKNTITKADIIQNPFIKILDPACGAGFFLLKAYDVLKEKFEHALPALREKFAANNYIVYKEGEPVELDGTSYWQKDNIHYHILKHCIYGADIDDRALWLCMIGLRVKDKKDFPHELNIIYCDSLIRWEKDYNKEQILNELSENRLVYSIKNNKEKTVSYVDEDKAKKILKRYEFWSTKFDYIIGNPPYVGHKELSMDYKRWLLDNYKEVFYDKSDLSYCFYQRAMEIANQKALISFISSRYFMESPTGRNLRIFLKENSRIIQIIDFQGKKVFPGIGIATGIFILSPDKMEKNKINIWKPKEEKLERIKEGDFEVFTVEQDSLLDERWILISHDKKEFLDKIESKSSIRLGDIVNSFQGIITGCDKAFVLEEKYANSLNIEKSLLKPWIKNSHVDKYVIKESNYKLIYSDLIDEPLKYPNSIMHIYKYKERLEGRRECIKGIRLWHQLQWGRKPELFLKDKIVYPFKSKSNRFALDTKGNFCSADVYSFVLKDDAEGYTLPFLLGVLNSSIYEFYFKLFAKKMGSGIYDYYPNTVMDLKIPDYEECKEIEGIAIRLIELYSENGDEDEKKVLESTIDLILKEYYSIGELESKHI